MASNKKNKTKKSLAQAKVRPAGSGAGESKVDGEGTSFAERKAKVSAKQQKADRKKRITTVVVVIFGILMALSMMLPSFSAMFANRSAANARGGEQEASANGSENSGSGTDSSAQGNVTSLGDLDARYSKTVSDLEAKLANDPNNLVTILNLGNDYMNWGYSGTRLAHTDSDATHVVELFQKAIAYYDRYLALNDSNAVKINRALCQLYSGDTEGAKAALEKMTQDVPDYGPAWANLGLVYELTGDSGTATSMYEKAKEIDPNDEYGAKTFAERRIIYMKARAESEAAQNGAGQGETESASGAAGLSEALNGVSGVSGTGN